MVAPQSHRSGSAGWERRSRLRHSPPTCRRDESRLGRFVHPIDHPRPLAAEPSPVSQRDRIVIRRLRQRRRGLLAVFGVTTRRGPRGAGVVAAVDLGSRPERQGEPTLAGTASPSGSPTSRCGCSSAAGTWEKAAGLPVRRLRHDSGASVYAFRHELDEWLRLRSHELANDHSGPDDDPGAEEAGPGWGGAGDPAVPRPAPAAPGASGQAEERAASAPPASAGLRRFLALLAAALVALGEHPDRRTPGGRPATGTGRPRGRRAAHPARRRRPEHRSGVDADGRRAGVHQRALAA